MPARALFTQALPVQAPSVQALSAQALSVQALSVQVLPSQASVQAPSAQAPSVEALLASPSPLTKVKEPRQPSLYKPPQPAQQLLFVATASTLPLVNAFILPSLPFAQYLYFGTANTDPNTLLHMD